MARLLRAAATLFTWNSSYNQVIITRSCLTSTSVSMLVTEPAVPDSSFLAVRLRYRWLRSAIEPISLRAGWSGSSRELNRDN